MKHDGYFTIDWSHIWLPYKGQWNKIKVVQEWHMKHVIIEMNDSNEPLMFHNSILGNYNFDMYFEDNSANVSSLDESL